MTRPRETIADALRVAREIVAREGADLALAARGADEAAIEVASDRLAVRIAQALLDAERDAAERQREDVLDPTIPHYAIFVRATH